MQLRLNDIGPNARSQKYVLHFTALDSQFLEMAPPLSSPAPFLGHRSPSHRFLSMSFQESISTGTIERQRVWGVVLEPWGNFLAGLV